MTRYLLAAAIAGLVTFPAFAETAMNAQDMTCGDFMAMDDSGQMNAMGAMEMACREGRGQDDDLGRGDEVGRGDDGRHDGRLQGPRRHEGDGRHAQRHVITGAGPRLRAPFLPRAHAAGPRTARAARDRRAARGRGRCGASGTACRGRAGRTAAAKRRPTSSATTPSPFIRLPHSRVVVAAAVHLADEAHHALRAVGVMRLEPVAEQRRDLARQAQDDVAGAAGAGVAGGLEQGLDLVVVEAGDHRADRDPHRAAGLGQAADREQTALGSGGARLHRAGEPAVEGGDGEPGRGQAVRAHRTEEVGVALDQRALGQDADRMAEVAEHAEDAAHDARTSSRSAGRGRCSCPWRSSRAGSRAARARPPAPSARRAWR